MTANGSSSSLANSAEPRFSADLIEAGLLGSLPAALLQGEDRDLLAPLRYLDPGSLPTPPETVADRAAIAAGLAETNLYYGHPEAAAMAAKLADPATRVIVTGQQPGLFGGPLYSLSKAVAAVRWAEELERQGQPAVAVFWVATEDHDFAEVAAARLLDRDGPTSLELPPDDRGLVPVGVRAVGAGIEGLLAAARELPWGPSHTDWWREVAGWYTPRATFAEAFYRLFVRVLGPRCPLLLDAMLPALKRAEAPWMLRMVDERETVAREIAQAETAITGRGYKLQIRPQPGLSPLFLFHEGQRRRIEWRDDGGWGLRGLEGASRPLAELRERIEDNPIIVSPGALARPALQDVTLGSTLQILGPGELSYMVQAAAVYRALEIPGPCTTLRPQAVVLDQRTAGLMSSEGLALDDLLADPSRLVQRLASEDPTTELRQQLTGDLERLREKALAIDPNLEKPWTKTRDGILRSLETFAGKVAAAEIRQDEVRRGRLDRLREAVLPGGKLQERSLAVGFLYGRYGEALVEGMLSQLSLDPRFLQAIRIEEAAS